MTVRIIQGDVRAILPTLDSDYFDCIVTSPPYWGLRDYGTASWEGGDDPACDHIEIHPQERLGRETPDGRGGSFPHTDRAYKSECAKCGARRVDAQIGLEPTLDEYLETMVGVCRELRRVLKPSGTFWLNIGDSFAANGVSGLVPVSELRDGLEPAHSRQRKTVPAGLKPKDLCLVPERLAIALQADGWWVRSRIIWNKLNPMPESCTDRPTSAHEHLWMLTKRANYFWDAEAVKEQPSETSHGGNHPQPGGKQFLLNQNIHGNLGMCTATRNIRNVWTLATHPFPGAHFATFPPALVERCIKAGTSERGCCVECGAPWVRQSDISYVDAPGGSKRCVETNMKGAEEPGVRVNKRALKVSVTTGWSPSCKCGPSAMQEHYRDVTGHLPGHPNLIPARILDPFAGAGTVGLVADRLGRDATLIDLKTSYTDMAVSRIKNDAPLFAEVTAS